MSKETNELDDERLFEYDAVGNRTKLTDRNGRETEYDYDSLYRLIEERWLDDTSSVIYTANFTYNAASEITSASDDFSDYQYALDDLGRVTLIEVDNGGPKVKLNQEFDAAGNRTELAAEFEVSSVFEDDFVNTYTYDNLHRMTRVEQTDVSGGNAVADKRVDFSYNELGQFTEIVRYSDLNGTNEVATTDYVYDELARLTDLTHTHDTTTIADYDWTYDAFSRVTSFTSPDGTSDYTYDETGQLTEADHDFQTDENYSYDENGNRTGTGFTTGTNNQFTSDGTFDYEYDPEGNRTTRTRISTDPADDYETIYEWDHHNRLVKLTYKNNSGTVTKEIEYTYDVYDRRIAKEIDLDGAGSGAATEEHFIYDGDGSNVNESQDIALVFDENGDLKQRNLFGPAIDQILASGDISTLSVPDEVLWALADNLGSVRDVVDNDGDVQNHIVYDSFGNITSESDDTVKLFIGFAGRERDYESDLYHNWKRYYEALTALWISQDPIGFNAGDTNLSRYVGNSPTNFTDPNGLEPGDALDRFLRWGASWMPGNTHQAMADAQVSSSNIIYGGAAPLSLREVGVAMRVAREEFVMNTMIKAGVLSFDENGVAILEGTGGRQMIKVMEHLALGDIKETIERHKELNENLKECEFSLVAKLVTHTSVAVSDAVGLTEIYEFTTRDEKGRAEDIVTLEVYSAEQTKTRLVQGVVKAGTTLTIILAPGAKIKTARASCFVAGTPVLVDDDKTESAEDFRLADAAIGVGAVGAVVGLALTRRRRKRQVNDDVPPGGELTADKDAMNSTEHVDSVVIGTSDPVSGTPTASDVVVCSPAADDANFNVAEPKATGFFGRWGIAICLLLALFFGGRSLWRIFSPPAEVASPLSFKNIEDIRVGDRVLADNPDVDSPVESSVDPATWRKLVLRAEATWDDGTVDDINVETLQSPEWIEEHSAVVGAVVRVFHGLPADVVRLADGLPAFDSSSGHPQAAAGVLRWVARLRPRLLSSLRSRWPL